MISHPDRSDAWNSGDAYEPYIGRWSRMIADLFVTWLDPASNEAWVEVGCGTGALTEAIVTAAAPASVLALEPSDGYIAFARRRVSHPAVTFEIGDASRLPLPDDSQDRAVSGLVINFIPDIPAALAEMARVTRPGGTIAAYVWDYAEGMEMLRHFWDVVIALDPPAAEMDEGTRFPMCRPEPLRDLWEKAGLTAVDVAPLDIRMRLRDFDELWAPFLGGQGPAPGYVASLAPDARDALREALSERIERSEEGAIELGARAWAVRGLVAGGAGDNLPP